MVKKVVAAKITNSPMKLVLVATLIGLAVVLITYMYNKMNIKKEGFTGEAQYEVVYVYSDTCPHCVSFTPIFDQYTATQVMNTRIKIIKVERKVAPAQYLSAVTGFPTVLLITTADGKVINKLVGRTTFTELQDFVQKNTK